MPSANEWSVPRPSAPDACGSSSGSPCLISMSTGDEPPYSDLCPARGRQRDEVPVLSNEACLQEERSPLARAIAALTADRTIRDRYVPNARAARPTARRRTRRASIASSRDDTRLSLASSSSRLGRPACLPALEPGQGTVGSHIDVRHLAATPIGKRVLLRATVAGRDGRRPVFRVEAYDEGASPQTALTERAWVAGAPRRALARSRSCCWTWPPGTCPQTSPSATPPGSSAPL